MGKAERVERTIAVVLSEYTAACAVSKANGVPKKARAFENLDLYVECKKLGAAFDDLDKAANGKELPYDVSSEPLVIAANDAIRERGAGADGKAWMKAVKVSIATEKAWRIALDAKTAAVDAETAAECKVVGGENVSLPGKGVDGASLAVPFTLFIADTGQIDVSNGRKAGTGSGPAAALADGEYHRTKDGKMARMTISQKGTVFDVTEPITGTFKSATTAAVKVSPALGYSSHSHNGLKFWKAGAGA